MQLSRASHDSEGIHFFAHLRSTGFPSCQCVLNVILLYKSPLRVADRRHEIVARSDDIALDRVSFILLGRVRFST